MAKNWIQRKTWRPKPSGRVASPAAGAAAPKLRAPAAPDFAARAKDLGDLRDAIDDAATTSFALWISYLFLLFYLLIAVGSVTHRDILLESPIVLPFLSDVKLPLVGFFVIGPLLFLIVHTYVLIHIVLLASKVGAFRIELKSQITDGNIRASLRRQLPNNFIVQLLAGPSDVRAGIISWMLWLIAVISLVAAPVALLLFFQLQFLPYHHGWVTWWHRFAILFDLAILWILVPSITRGRISFLSWESFWRIKIASLAAVSIASLLFAFTIATFPSERLHDAWPLVRFVPTAWPSTELAEEDPRQIKSKVEQRMPLFVVLARSMKLRSLHELLVAGEIDPITQRPVSLWSNRLVAPNVEVMDRVKFDSDEKVDKVRETFSLRGRHLEGAVLSGANLRKVDLTAAQLQGAVLNQADLRQAKLVCAPLTPPNDCTNLRGASLEHAKLQGAFLDGAQLQGASLYYARLQGAWLLDANLQGALLMRAQLQGATLERAQLEGAFLSQTYLQGAQLDKAKLQGASLDDTQLQGASLENAETDGARFVKVFVWRTHPAFAVRKFVVPDTKTGQFYREFGCPWPQECSWSADAFEVLKQSIGEIPEGERRVDALKKIEILDPLKSDEGDQVVANWQKDGARRSDEEHSRARAAVLQALGCELQEAPYIIRRFIETFESRIDLFLADNPQLVAAFLDDRTCSGARGLTKIDKARLADIRDQKTQSAGGSTVGSAGRR